VYDLLVKKIIVTTTINPPTKALIDYSVLSDWKLIVVGDLKTPHHLYSDLKYSYYSPADQEKDFQELSELIGWNTIQRRNLGFLKALEMGAEIIATVDDDNIPLKGWGENLIVGQRVEINSYVADKVFDPLSVTNYPHLWHRGFPIQRLLMRDSKSNSEKIFVDIEASFWNGDPDIDAICRMEHGPTCEFDSNLFPFTSPQFSPFNSQNTFLTRRALKRYFMFPKIGRMDDIWSAYYLEAEGFRVAYTQASVRQERNVHDLTVDFTGEIIGYQKTDSLLNALVESPELIKDFIGEESNNAFQLYLKEVEKLD
jgi:hypothetical protein